MNEKLTTSETLSGHLKIHFICPVRHVTPEQQAIIDDTLERLELAGHKVHNPVRDVNQDDPTGGYEICRSHLEAMRECDVVAILYLGKSTGIHFDLGMAFALGKPLWLVANFDEEVAPGKSYFKVIQETISHQGSKINSRLETTFGNTTNKLLVRNS